MVGEETTRAGNWYGSITELTPDTVDLNPRSSRCGHLMTEQYQEEGALHVAPQQPVLSTIITTMHELQHLAGVRSSCRLQRTAVHPVHVRLGWIQLPGDQKDVTQLPDDRKGVRQLV